MWRCNQPTNTPLTHSQHTLLPRRNDSRIAKREVPLSTAPKWPELGVAEVWPRLLHDKDLLRYFPREWSEDGVPADRTFMWKILYALRPHFTETLVREA